MISLAYAPIALLLYPNFTNLVILAFIENFAMGLVPYVLIDKFDVQYRASGLGVSYNWGLVNWWLGANDRWINKPHGFRHGGDDGRRRDLSNHRAINAVKGEQVTHSPVNPP